MFVDAVSFPAALLAGLLSFFAPCILPLIPAYFTFITGMSLDELTNADQSGVRSKVILSTLSYVAGFSLVFVLLGASASFLGTWMQVYGTPIRIVGGVLILLLGIHLMGIFRIRALEVEKKFQVREKPLHLLGTFLVGMAFAAGWSPCVGPLLGSILVIAGNQDSVWQGVALLSVYSAGLAIPFIALSVFINYLLVFLQRTRRMVRYLNYVAGALLIVVGLSLITNKLAF